MWELLPEFWNNPASSEGTPRLERMKARSQQITVWAQCFALYVSVLAQAHPEYISELMAYMCTIIRASQEYEDPAWFAYDIAYRQQVAATHHKDWSKINPSLFPLCFSSSAKKTSCCSRCNVLGHVDKFCPLRGKEKPDITQRVHAVESAVLVFSNAGRGKFSSNCCGCSKGVYHEFNAGITVLIARVSSTISAADVVVTI